MRFQLRKRNYVVCMTNTDLGLELSIKANTVLSACHLKPLLHFKHLKNTSINQEIMKIFLTAVLTSLLLVALTPNQLHAAPSYISSEELGRAVEKVKEMFTNEMRAKTVNSYSQQILGGQTQQIYESDATAQVRGIDIQNCGIAGFFINLGLQIGLGGFADSFGVLVNCRDQGNCVRVRVDAPADQ